MGYKYLVFLFFATLSIGIKSQDTFDTFYMENEIDVVEVSDGKFFYFLNNEDRTPLHGRIRVIIEDEPIYSEAEFVEGYINGFLKIYQNNILMVEMEFKEGKRGGQIAEYYEDGKLRIKGYQENRRKVGDWEYFDEDGTVMEKCTFSPNGVLIQKIAYFYNGNVSTEKNYDLNGKEHGVYKLYKEDGTLTDEYNYVHGEMHGRQMAFSGNGEYITIWHKDNGKYEGEYQELYVESGNIKVQGNYLNGRKDGKFIYRDEQGNITKEEVYEKGELIESTGF